jgi:GT2 family glycosyltransferase
MDDGVAVLIPTYRRPAALAATLATVAAQSHPALQVVLSDQSDTPSYACPEVAAVLRMLRALGHEVHLHHHLPRRGLAEQRAFLLAQSAMPYSLCLDDDVLLEPDLVARLLRTIRLHECGFVGSAVHGLSHVGSVRPHQQAIEFWEGKVTPETIVPDGPAWARHHLHSAANLYHVQTRLKLPRGAALPYRVAWVGGCVLFDTAKLRAAGGFDFWRELPDQHCGEDVLAQLRVMARFGGCAIIPSGAYHMELPTTVPVRDCDAPRVLWRRTGAVGA